MPVPPIFYVSSGIGTGQPWPTLPDSTLFEAEIMVTTGMRLVLGAADDQHSAGSRLTFYLVRAASLGP